MRFIVNFKQEIEAFSVKEAAEKAVEAMTELGDTHHLILEVAPVGEDDVEDDFEIVVVQDGEAEKRFPGGN